MIWQTFFILFNIFYFTNGEFPKNNNVYELDNSNFHSFFENSEFVVLKYYKTGCPACSNFEPMFQDLAKSFIEETNIRFAEVNIMDQVNRPISHYLFKDPSKPAHFPTIKLYYKGLEDEVQFSERERNLDTLTTWIKRSIEEKTSGQKTEL